jgi:hypothetical protein
MVDATGQRRKLIMLYVGLLVGAMLGSFISIILLVLVKELKARSRSSEIPHEVLQE